MKKTGKPLEKINGRPPRSELQKLRSKYWYVILKMESETRAALAKAYVEPTDYLLSAKYGKDVPVNGAERTKIFEMLRKKGCAMPEDFLTRVDTDYPGARALYESPIWRFLENPIMTIEECQSLLMDCIVSLGLNKQDKRPVLPYNKFRYFTSLTEYEFDYFEKLYELLISVPIFRFQYPAKDDYIKETIDVLALLAFFGAAYREAYLAHNLRVALAIDEFLAKSETLLNQFETSITDIKIIKDKNEETEEQINYREKRQARWSKLVSTDDLHGLVPLLNTRFKSALFADGRDMIDTPGKHLALVKKSVNVYKQSALENWLTIHFEYLWGNKKLS